MTAHTTRAHAKRSPSAAYRWLNCPGSIRMSEGLEERRSSVYADEGTAAHMLAERCLHTNARAEAYAGRVINITGKEPHEQFLMQGSPLTEGRFEVDEEMVDGVQLFVDTVLDCLAACGPSSELHVERRVNFGDDEDFGTADAMVFDPVTRHLYVFDLKYGSGKLVEVRDANGDPNPQLICYGEGGTRAVDGDISGLTITIVQPRMPHPDGPVRPVEIGPLELLDWSLEIAAGLAATEDPNAPLVAGPWCQWCPAAGVCPALAQRALTVAQSDFDDLQDGQLSLPAPQHLSPRQIAKILDGEKLLKAWLEAVNQHAYAEAEAGRPIPGYKLVDKVPRRKWRDVAEAAKAAEQLAGRHAYTEPELKTPAQIEKLVGKKEFAAKLAALAPPVSSGTTLAPQSDRRPEVTRQIEDHFDDLSDAKI